MLERVALEAPLPLMITNPRWLLVVPLLAVSDRVEGVRAYERGSFDEARKHFATAAANADGSDAEVYLDWALSALRSGQLEEVDRALTQAASAARGENIARTEFLRGNLGFARGERHAALAARAESEPFAYDLAIRDFERAQHAWVRAALAECEPAAACRNAERALRRARELQLLRDRAAAERKRSESAAQPEAKPIPTANEQTPDTQPEPTGESAASDEPAVLDQRPLTAPQIEALIQRIAAREASKRNLRIQHQLPTSRSGEQDW